jgi:archaellum component FlaC
MHKGTITSEDNSESVNELQCVEAALSTLLSEATCGEKLQGVHEKLKTLENAIESIEDGLENLFRRLIKTRSSLLNIISQ